jgi:hypothetical protein
LEVAPAAWPVSGCKAARGAIEWACLVGGSLRRSNIPTAASAIVAIYANQRVGGLTHDISVARTPIDEPINGSNQMFALSLRAAVDQ